MIRNAIWLFILTSAVLMLFLPSYQRWQDLEQKNSGYTKQIELIKKDTALLAREKKRLEEDPVYLEKVAREKMGLAREGEVVYKLAPVTQNKVVSKKSRKVVER